VKLHTLQPLSVVFLAVPLAAQGSDSCASAQAISGLGSFAVTNVGATGPDAQPGCEDPGPDVWFEWTPLNTATVEFDLCDADYDCVLALWDGAGCPTQVLACNDDDCGTRSRIEAPVTGGSAYMIQVGGWSGATGSGTLTLTETGPPANDDCANAEPIVGAGTFLFDCTYATTDGQPEVGCTSGSGQIDHDVWFRWTSPWDGAATVTTCNLASFDTQMAVYPWNGCPVGPSLVCNDDSCGLRSRLVFLAVAGQEYAVRVGSWATSPGGPGAIEVSEGGIVFSCDDPPAGPDVIVGNLTTVQHWGAVGGVSGYSIGATACNVGDSTMPWEGPTNHHPVIAQHLYRIEDGSFEQLGMSWVKHGFASATEDYCCPCNVPGSGQIMGIGCADTYGAATNGQQGSSGTGGLGPRSEIDPVTGDFPFPYGTQGQTGNAIYKRLQLAHADLDPALHPGAQYIAEVQYVNPDDAAAGHGLNNASWRPATIGAFTGGGWQVALTDTTRATEPAIFAWAEQDPLVRLETVDVPGDGRFHLASRVSDNLDGSFHYELVVHNLNSRRGADAVSLFLAGGSTVTGAGFHGPAHHSGEPYDTADWDIDVQPRSLAWTVATPGNPAQPLPNVLRWGTSYTLRFDVDAPPIDGFVTISLHEPGGAGEPDLLNVPAHVPDGACEVIVRCASGPNSTGSPARIGHAGSVSTAANDLTLLASGLPPSQFGLFFYGAGEAQLPFGNGLQCVTGGGVGLFRLPILSSGPAGEVAFALDVTSPPQASGQITPNTTWGFQYWFRDPAASGAFFDLSDALRVTFCP